MATLHAKQLSLSLQQRRVVHSVEAELRSGEVLGVIGPNGSGKSTFLKGFAGLLKPDEGALYLEGVPFSSLPAQSRAQKLAYLPQSPECYWPLEVEALVRLGRLPFPDRDGEAESAVVKALSAVEALHLRGRSVDELSGGERGRVFLARALVGDPQFLLVDEPGAGLDPYHQLQLMELLRLRAVEGSGVCVVLHDLSLAARFCDRLMVMQSGRLLYEGSPAEVLTPERLAEAQRITAYRNCHEGTSVLIPWQRVESAKVLSEPRRRGGDEE